MRASASEEERWSWKTSATRSSDGLAWITIDRPERMNAFRARTVDEMIRCLKRAWASSDVGVVCLTGEGDRAFCTGGDQKQRAETGDYGPSRVRAVRGRVRSTG